MNGEANNGAGGAASESWTDSRWRELMNQPDAACKLAKLSAMLDPALAAVEPDEAISRAANLWHASLERAELSVHLSESWDREMRASNEGEWLIFNSQARDDSFRQYLRKAGAPGSILKRGFVAHRNALLRHNLLFNEARRDGKKVFSLRPAYADKYVKAELDVRAKTARRRRDARTRVNVSRKPAKLFY